MDLGVFLIKIETASTGPAVPGKCTTLSPQEGLGGSTFPMKSDRK